MCMLLAILNLSRALSLCKYVSVSLSLLPATHAALCCIAWQHIATHCNTLQHTATHLLCAAYQLLGFEQVRHTMQHTATHCNTLQHIETHCNTLQHTATQRHCYLDRLRALTLAHPRQSMFIYLWSHSTQNSLVLVIYHQHHNYS